MILLVDLSYKKDSLGFYEFVLPVAAIIKKIECCVIKHYSEVMPGDVGRCSKVVLSGTALKDNAFLEDLEVFGWVKTCNKPILGICAGMEVIGAVFNSSLKECREIGMREIEVIKENPLLPSRFRAYELHRFTVLPSSDFDVLAKTGKCIQAIKHRKREIYGVMFHPEVRNKEIIERFVLLRG